MRNVQQNDPIAQQKILDASTVPIWRMMSANQWKLSVQVQAQALAPVKPFLDHHEESGGRRIT